VYATTLRRSTYAAKAARLYITTIDADIYFSRANDAGPERAGGTYKTDAGCTGGTLEKFIPSQDLSSFSSDQVRLNRTVPLSRRKRVYVCDAANQLQPSADRPRNIGAARPLGLFKKARRNIHGDLALRPQVAASLMKLLN